MDCDLKEKFGEVFSITTEFTTEMTDKNKIPEPERSSGNEVECSDLLASCSFCKGRGSISFKCWMFGNEMDKECSFCWGSGTSSHLS